MRLAPILVLTLALTSCLAQGRRWRGEPPTLSHLTHQEGRFDSPAVGREMPYGVYLPKDYDADEHENTKWPLVIWLHGMWENHERFHVRGGGKVLDKAVGDGTLPPCVFVLANGGRTSMYVNGGKDRNYQDLIQKDLIAHVDKTFRVSKRRDERALMGISMGGMAAMRIAWAQPGLFGTLACHSSAVFVEDPKQLDPRLLRLSGRIGLDDVFGNPIDEQLWHATNPLCIAAKLEPKQLEGLRFFFDAGTSDRWQFGPPNQKLHEVLKGRKVEHTFELVKGSGHAWGEGVEVRLVDSLRFVGDSFRAAATGGDAAAPKGETVGGKKGG
ncbi:MAG: esterase family protein [bacterium]|nr:esterase family protein [bacterium]